MSMSLDRRSPQPPANTAGSSSVRSSNEYSEDDTLSGHVTRAPHAGNGSSAVQHSARISRGLGAAGHEILGGSSERSALHQERGSISGKESAPLVQRMPTPTNGGKLSIDASDDAATPVSIPSISDKLRSLKLKSRAGRTPSASGHMPGMYAAGPINAFPMPAGGGAAAGSTTNSRAASAFVRRPSGGHNSGGFSSGPDELDHIVDGYSSVHGAQHPPRPVSHAAHHPLPSGSPNIYGGGASYPSSGAQTPLVRRSYEYNDAPSSTNSSYDGSSSSPSAAASAAAMSSGLSSLHQRASRRRPPQSASIVSTATTAKDSQLSHPSSASYSSSSSNHVPHSPSSSSTNSLYGYGGGGGGLRSESAFHSAAAMEQQQQGGGGIVGPPTPTSRRPRFVSEPVQPLPHLQQQQQHSPTSSHVTPFGAERARAQAQQHPGSVHPQSASSNARAISSASYSSNNHQHAHASMGIASISNFSAQFAELMGEEGADNAGGDMEEDMGLASFTRRGELNSSPTPYSSAFADAPSAAGTPAQKRSPSSSNRNAYTAYDERPIGGGGGGGGGGGHSAHNSNGSGSGFLNERERVPSRNSAHPARGATAGHHGGVPRPVRTEFGSRDFDHQPLDSSSAVSPPSASHNDFVSHPPPATKTLGRAASPGLGSSSSSAPSPSFSTGPAALPAANWDMTPAQAAAMGLLGDNSSSHSPPTFAAAAFGEGGSGRTPASSPPASASKPRPKPLVRGNKPSVSIPAGSPGAAAAAVAAAASSGAATPAASPGGAASLVSPMRARNPRMSTLTTPVGRDAGRDPVSSPGGGSGGDESNYIQSADLPPWGSHPASTEVNTVLKGLQSADWSARFDALTSVRRLIVHHPACLASHTKALVRDLKSEVNSLRSSLAKNSLMALGDAFSCLPRAFEVELEQLGPAVLKRAGEPSGFLRDEAHRALLAMLSHCSDRFTLPLLLNAVSTGTKPVKTMAIVYLDRAIDILGSKAGGAQTLVNNKEFPRLLKSIGSSAGDAAVESRTHSRWSLIRLARLMGLEELDKALQRGLPPAHYHTVSKVFSKGMDALLAELQAATKAQQAQQAQQLAASSDVYAALASPTNAGGTGSMRNRAASAAGGGHSAFSVQLSELDATTSSEGSSGFGSGVLGSTGSGTDSKRAPRRKPAGSPSADREPSASPAMHDDSAPGSTWSSVRSHASAATGPAGNMFDLESDYGASPPVPALAASAPAGAVSAAVAAAGGPRTAGKRRPTLSAGGGLGGGSLAPPSVAENERLNAVLQEMASPDWRIRLTGLEKLNTYLTAGSSSASHAAAYHAVRIFDALGARIGDHHGKVNVLALQSLSTILPASRAYLPSVLGSFIPLLAAHLASTSPVIRQLAQAGLEQLVCVLDAPRENFSRELQAALLAPLAQVSLFENVKVRPAAIHLLTGVLDSCAEACAATGTLPAVATFKATLPLAYATLDEARTEIRAPLLRCAQTLYALLGAGLWDDKMCMQFHIQPQQVGKLRTLLGV